jgi:hypothetical protein
MSIPALRVDERLSSWGSYLPSRSTSQSPRLATSQQPAALPSQESDDPSQNSGRHQIAAPGNSAASSEGEGVKPGLATGGATPNQITAESTTEPLVTKPPVRKSGKRSRSAKHRVMVANADPWMADGLDAPTAGGGLGCLCSVPFQGSWVDETALSAKVSIKPGRVLFPASALAITRRPCALLSTLGKDVPILP